MGTKASITVPEGAILLLLKNSKCVGAQKLHSSEIQVKITLHYIEEGGFVDTLLEFLIEAVAFKSKTLVALNLLDISFITYYD